MLAGHAGVQTYLFGLYIIPLSYFQGELSPSAEATSSFWPAAIIIAYPVSTYVMAV